MGGHLEPGESPQEALAREVREETGWILRRIEAVAADWEWEHDGVVRRELDYLVEVEGDLGAPRLEEGKHDAHAWVGPKGLDLLTTDRAGGDQRLRDIVAKASRTRLTERLRLEPIGGEHTEDLWRLHDDADIAHWYGGRWSHDHAIQAAAHCRSGWEEHGVHKWIAYDRASGALIGRGGLSQMDARTTTAARITALLLAGSVWAPQCLELGWAVLSSHRGHGFATELGAASLEFARDTLGARTVVSFTERHNAASRAVMQRLGLSYLGDFEAPGLVEGRAGIQQDAPFVLHVLIG